MITRRDFTKLSLGVAALVASGADVHAASDSRLAPTMATPRRVGRQLHGAYWGMQGERIDLLSGNLNFIDTLVTPTSRKLKLALRASYNSQLHIDATQATQHFGTDLGYGMGWKLQFASVTPTTDRNGKQGYRLEDGYGTEHTLVNCSSGWLCLDDEYQTWIPGTSTLHRADGTRYIFNCVSGNKEPDAGTLYPTQIVCTNGNTIDIDYLPGLGETKGNTSARIRSINDALSIYADGSATYTFEYSQEALPHLQSIAAQAPAGPNTISFKYSQQSFSSPLGRESRVAAFVESITRDSSVPKQFTYGSSGELSEVQLESGGNFRWEHRSFTFPDGTTVREVASRHMRAATGDAEQTHRFERSASATVAPLHADVTLHSSSGSGRKTWYFFTEGENLGLVRANETIADNSLVQRTDLFWACTGNGAPYISSRKVVSDPSSSDAFTKITSYQRDEFGNLTQTVHRGSGSNATARVLTHDYLRQSTYLKEHILNRQLRTTLSQGEESYILAEAMYDSTPVSSVPGITNHTDAVGSPNGLVRGNLTENMHKGKLTRRQYDSTGSLLSIVDSVGSSLEFRYASDSNHTVISQRIANHDPQLSATLTHSKGRLTRVDEANGASTDFEYDGNGMMTAANTPKGKVGVQRDRATNTIEISNGPKFTRVAHDGIGRLRQVVHGNSTGVASQRDYAYSPVADTPAGKMSGATLPHRADEIATWITNEFDEAGRLVGHHGSARGSKQIAHRGNTRTVSDPTGRWKKVTYDFNGRIAKVTQPNPSSGSLDETLYSYNALGALSKVVMPRADTVQKRSFSYNSKGQLTRRQFPESGAIAYTYFPDGTLASKTDAKGQKEELHRDARKRVTERRYFDARGRELPQESTKFFYDSNPLDADFSQNTLGRIAALQWGSAESIPGLFTESFTYTQTGSLAGKRLTLKRGDHSASLELTQTFNEAGQIERIYYPAGGPVLVNHYDADGKLVGLHSNEAAIVKNVSYNPTGQLLQFDVLASRDNQYMTEKHEYDANDRIARIKASPAETDEYSAMVPNINIGYEYAASDGKLVQETDQVTGQRVKYAYDSQGRLSEARASDKAWGLAFTYDSFGNRTQQKVTVGQAYEADNSFDPATNWLLSEVASYDANGNMLSLPYTQLQYDARNRVVKVEHSGTENYAYDPDDRRIWRKRAIGTETLSFHHNGKRIAAYEIVTKSDGTFSFALQDTFIHFGRRVVRSQGEAILLDRLGSVRAWSDRKGAKGATYLPFGELLSGDASRASFDGYVSDPSQLSYAGKRYYSSALGRFVTPDPKDKSAHVSDPASWNRYAFVNNDPINNIDPNGLDNSVFQVGHTYEVPDGNGAVVTVTGEGTGVEYFPDGSSANVTITDFDTATSATEVINVDNADGTSNSVNVSIGDGATPSNPSSDGKISDDLKDVSTLTGIADAIAATLVTAGTDAETGSALIGGIEIAAETVAFLNPAVFVAVLIGAAVLYAAGMYAAHHGD